MTVLDMKKRPRRNRKTQAIRNLVKETVLSIEDLICPFFVSEGQFVKQPIKSMPGVYKWSPDFLLKEVEKLLESGIYSVILFPVINKENKDIYGSFAVNPNGIFCQTIKILKSEFPELCVITDVALDPYTIHGHDGIIDDKGCVLNDESVRFLGEVALLHAEMGADIVAPSDMMDGRIGYIRAKLDRSNFQNVSIMSYSVKYASSLYSPFRDALSSHVSIGNKNEYQIKPENVREALSEIVLDDSEGADILIIKPASFYLDVIYRSKQESFLPIAAFQVSGEYSMIVAAAQNGWLDKDKVFYESLIGMKRAGADMIITYAAPYVIKIIKDIQG
ncbi:MAG: porphobilinogen synthase [Victivallaceae bacterium]